MWGADGIGRHVGFKIPCRKACEFKSRAPYQHQAKGADIFSVRSVKFILSGCRNIVGICRNAPTVCFKTLGCA